jgi:hypothetical protein
VVPEGGEREVERAELWPSRKIERQSTLGVFADKTAMKDGKDIIIDTVYHNDDDYLLDDAEVEKLHTKDREDVLPAPMCSTAQLSADSKWLLCR